MKHAGVRVGIGTRFAYDGEVFEVVEPDQEMYEVVELHGVGGIPEVLARNLRTQTVRRFSLSEVMSERSHLLSEDLVVDVADTGGDTAAVKWAAVPESARCRARERAAHVREILTGYRFGVAEAALPGEPRARYKATVPKQVRVKAKAEELGKGFRTIERWVSLYEAEGEVGLIPDRAVQPALGSKHFQIFRMAALDVMTEYVEMSKRTKGFVIQHARARVVATYGVGGAPLPERAMAYEIVNALEVECPTLSSKSMKRIRDIAARPVLPYGKLHPSRPGEYMLMDTTPLDVFAMDPHTLRWVGVELTVGMDWYSPCITGLRLTPVSTKAIDAASVLYQSFRPMPAGRDWPANAVWPPHGVPRSVLVEQEVLDPASVFAATPAVVPDTVVIDHGKICRPTPSPSSRPCVPRVPTESDPLRSTR